jgi:nitrogen fixation NifU-like protein
MSIAAGDLRDLYQDVILDHGKRPRNRRALTEASCHAHGKNPLCGDEFEVELKLDATGRIEDIAFHGQGCAISVASASIMTELLRGKSQADAAIMFDSFHCVCTEDDAVLDASLGEDEQTYLTVLSGVRQFPVRVKCATLAWHTMRAALAGMDAVSSENDGQAGGL